MNGGTCSDGVNSYTCLCAAGYSGVHCEGKYSLCMYMSPLPQNDLTSQETLL